jgi:uroporphyrinogen-III synthase
MLPLARRRILVTRASHQASELAGRLRALGADPILIPTIEIAPPTSYAALDAALAQLATFDLLAFTSANAVHAFQQRARHLGIHLTPNSIRIAAVGPSTARALQSIGLHANILPPTYTAESLAATLAPTALNQRILLVRPEDANLHSGAPSIAAPGSPASGLGSLGWQDGWDVNPPTDPLSTILELAGAHITIASAYTNRIPTESLTAITHLFSDPARYPDAIIFTSASTALNLVALLEAAALTLPTAILRASIGPITSRTLRDLNLPPHIEAAEPAIPALTAALAAHFQNSSAAR